MTRKDLEIEYLREHGEYPPDSYTFNEWLVDMILRLRNTLGIDTKVLELLKQYGKI